MILHELNVHMASFEWSSTHPMEQIADELFEKYKDLENLVIRVYEHAGWYLIFAKEGEKTIIVGTANDAATITPERQRFWERVKGAEHRQLPTIRRGEESALKHRMQVALNLPDSDFDFHATDLYVRATPEARKWLKENYAHYSIITLFVSQIDKQMWLDVPFAGKWK